MDRLTGASPQTRTSRFVESAAWSMSRRTKASYQVGPHVLPSYHLSSHTVVLVRKSIGDAARPSARRRREGSNGVRSAARFGV